jgi:chemotaxis protein CheX
MNTQLLVDAFTDATIYVMKVMAFVEPVKGEVINKNETDLSGDVSGIIGMTTSGKNLSLAISFSKEAAFIINKTMFGEDATELNAEIGDLVGEMSNMICGSARKTLSEHGIFFEHAIPVVVIGENQTIHPVGATSTVITFKVKDSSMFIEISVEK